MCSIPLSACLFFISKVSKSFHLSLAKIMNFDVALSEIVFYLRRLAINENLSFVNLIVNETNCKNCVSKGKSCVHYFLLQTEFLMS